MAQSAAQKAAAAKAKAKEAAYIKSFSNPITSQYDPRIEEGGRVDSAGNVVGYNPEMAVAKMTSAGQAPKKVAVTPTPLPPDTPFPKAGTILKYLPGKTGGKLIPVYADGKGGEYEGAEVDPTILPGSGGGDVFAPERTLASDTFKNTLATIFGITEASQPWVGEIFKLASGFYKSGSSVSEALNLSLYDAKQKGLAPQFTKRFEGVFKLQERLQKGEAISVPTIAEFIKAESDIGDILREVGMPELANQEFLGSILGKGKSVLEVGNLISDVFNAIDNAPTALKEDLQANFPGVDRVSIAKAILMGEQGAAELKKKVEGLSVQSAAKGQGLVVDLRTAGDLAALGYGYGSSLEGFGTVKNLERGQVLGQANAIDFTQQEAIAATFQKNAAAQEKIRKISEAESNKWRGSSGTAGSMSLASKNRAAAI